MDHSHQTGCVRRALSLIELLVVLFIISVMIGLLVPAVQATRARMRATVCQNNVRQVGIALQSCIYTLKRFPDKNKWTVDILKWMEEWPLADEVAGGIPKNAVLPRPPLFRCPSQPDVQSTVPAVYVCHYVLAVDRPRHPVKGDRYRWELSDREQLSEDDGYDPWYVGPEITFAERARLFKTRTGPHASGEFYTNTGDVRGID